MSCIQTSMTKTVIPKLQNNISGNASQNTLYFFAHVFQSCFPLVPSTAERSRLSLHLVCQQVLKVQPTSYTASNTHNNPQNGQKKSIFLVKSWTLVSWTIQRDSPLYLAALTCGGEHTSPRVIYEWLQAQMWICRRWQPEGRQTPVYQREELIRAAPGETQNVHINSSVCTAL